ncbi:MAG: NAD(P)H-quinone oxidoreductase subunit 2, chloroplastic [Phycisphaerae bacterium]|nr:NAD(P)H-quinone oxidoreductase subunit 2, chloroplastic [Phycisphaerae bacterium]
MPPTLDIAVSAARLLPELVLIVAGCGLLLLATASRNGAMRLVPPAALAAILVALLALRAQPLDESTFGGGLAAGALAEFVRVNTLIMGVLFVLANWTTPPEDERGEFFAMLLYSLAGLMFVGLSDNLLVLFVALELVSIPSYVMVTLSRRGPAPLEAGTKYFYLGAMAAAVTAYGFSFLYGATGTVGISAGVRQAASILADPSSPAYGVLTIGLVLSIAGLLFKLAAVPLHFYVADVYQGAASPVAGFLGFVPKLAGLAALFKILSLTDWRVSPPLYWLLWLVAALSMTVGNILALRQSSLKRMLAYSGVAHAGYMLVGIIASPIGAPGVLGDGYAAVLYYVVVYGIANLGAFVLLALLRVNGRPCESIRDLAGLLARHPLLAVTMSLMMLTLMGLPPTPGFWGKMSLFGSALAAAGSTPDARATVALVVIAALNSAIGAAYYLRVVAACLLFENDQPAEAAPLDAPRTGAILCGFLLLTFTFAPTILMSSGRAATSGFRTLTPPPGAVVARTLEREPAAANGP